MSAAGVRRARLALSVLSSHSAADTAARAGRDAARRAAPRPRRTVRRAVSCTRCAARPVAPRTFPDIPEKPPARRLAP
ncbi:hypothetical protein GCM10010517_33780 [Streptosporangium fragile]|uniref:Uncharacterized protein n=1 Tax=Streptosporangium fragile TaxID=46186 RepID=A0ABP6IDQ5_9ACTN